MRKLVEHVKCQVGVRSGAGPQDVVFPLPLAWLVRLPDFFFPPRCLFLNIVFLFVWNVFHTNEWNFYFSILLSFSRIFFVLFSIALRIGVVVRVRTPIFVESKAFCRDLFLTFVK